MIRFVGRIVVLALLALLGAFGGDLRCFFSDPVVTVEQARSDGPVAIMEPAQDAESTESLEEPSERESVAVTLAPPPGEIRGVVAPSFVRASVIARAQAAPPTVDDETPTRPPRG